MSRSPTRRLWADGIKAPKGWRKSPHNSGKYPSDVRFRCDDLKYALTPEEVETLRAKLYLSLELT